MLVVLASVFCNKSYREVSHPERTFHRRASVLVLYALQVGLAVEQLQGTNTAGVSSAVGVQCGDGMCINRLTDPNHVATFSARGRQHQFESARIAVDVSAVRT